MSADHATASILKAASIPTVVVAVVAVIVGFLLKGGPGLIGALVGGIVACAFFIGGQLAVTKILENNPQIAMTGAFAVYLGQVLVLFILIAVLRDATWLDGRVLAATVLACTIVWIVASVVAWQRTSVLVVDVPSSTDPASSPAIHHGDAEATAIAAVEPATSEIRDGSA